MECRDKRISTCNFNFKLTFSDLDIVFGASYNKTCKRSKKDKVKLMLWRCPNSPFAGFQTNGKLFYPWGGQGALFIGKEWL